MICDVCGDTLDWCPQSPSYIPVAERTRDPKTQQIIWCSYCDGPGGFVSNSGHSTACFRYIKPKRGSQ